MSIGNNIKKKKKTIKANQLVEVFVHFVSILDLEVSVELKKLQNRKSSNNHMVHENILENYQENTRVMINDLINHNNQ